MEVSSDGREALGRRPPEATARITNHFPPLNQPSNKSSNQGNLSKFAPENFDKYLELDFGEVNRRLINPYQIKQELESITGSNIGELVGTSRSKLSIKTLTAEQSQQCLSITSLAGKSCSIRRHPTFNDSRGLILVRTYDLDVVNEFKLNLSDQCSIEKIEKAPFIKLRDGSTAYIVTFSQELPYSLYIPGELADTVVYPFKSRPMLCKKCLHYGHTKKRCKSETQRCQRCSDTGHSEDDCSAPSAKCLHCQEAHRTGHRDCARENQEQKVLDIVEKQKVRLFPHCGQTDPTPTK